MRPNDITPEDLEQWEKDCDQDTGIPTFMKELSPFFRELFYAGAWISKQLKAVGADDQTRHDVCFAFGQRAVTCNQDSYKLWALAKETVERFNQGDVDQPGSKLADEINSELLGDSDEPS